MRRYLTLTIALCTIFLVLFGIASAMGIPLLTDPGPLLRSASIATAVIGIALLIADVVLPVPSSVIMFAFGAAFGLWNGALLSMIGAIGASLAGFAIGRGGRDAVRRFVRDDELDRASTLLDRWGTLALIATRPVPILAETTAILAGTSRIGWLRMTALSAIGSAAPAILYAWAGSSARQPAEGIVVFLIVLAFSGAMWWIGRRTS
jgi:uncharacterized membrane protein YdjX (TVP38/TMEM64 family)